MPRAASNSTVSSMAIEPRSGVSRPAIIFTTDVFPAPEGPNKRRHAARRVEAHGKFQRAKLLLHVDGEHDHSPWKRMVARRASHSEASSAANANTIAIKTSRPAAASPPGTWVKV